MINEIEKTFYDTFGIERKRNHEVTLEAISGGVKSANLSQKPFYEYPQITDRILLELICILSEWRTYLHSSYTIKANNTLNLKQDVLKDFLELFKWYEFKKCEKGIKQQVRTLFEEVKNENQARN